MKRSVLAIFTGALLSAAAVAQVPQDTWVVSSFNLGAARGGLQLVSADRTTITTPTGQSADTQDANCVVADGNGVVYYGTLQSVIGRGPNQGQVFQVIVSGGAVVAETRLTTQAPDAGSITGLTLRGDQVWYVTDAGSVGWVPVPSAGNPPPFVPNNVFHVNQQGNVGGAPQSVTTDGREIFIGIGWGSSSNDPFSIWALDAEDPAAFRGVALPDTRSVFDMSLGRDGKIVAGLIGGHLYEIDPVTGATTHLNPSLPAPQGNANGSAIDPWSNLIGVVPGSGSPGRQLDHFDVASGTWLPNLAGPMTTAVPTNVTVAVEPPFELRGAGCDTANGVEPRMRWRGMPVQGGSFDLTLRDAPVSAPCFLLLGLQAAAGGGVALGPIGAPGCTLLTSSDVAIAASANGTGDASVRLAVPTGPFLGAELHGQWVTISQGNSLGVALTEAVRVRVR